jgi:hypothetical protein
VVGVGEAAKNQPAHEAQHAHPQRHAELANVFDAAVEQRYQ